MVKSCGNLKAKCGYRYERKLCKKPKGFKCKDILNRNYKGDF